MSTVIVFGGGLQALSVARSLKECHHVVVVLAYNDKIIRRSNYIDDYINIDSIQGYDVIRQIVDCANKVRADIIIPMGDEQAGILSRYKYYIENNAHVQCAVMDYEVFNIVSDKWRLMSFCGQHGIPYPKTEIINGNYEYIANVVGFPALIKPNHSVGARGITLVNDIDELEKIAPKIIEQYGACTLQEYIIAKDYYFNVMLYRSDKGIYSNHVIMKILRYYPVGGGSSCFGVTVENETLLEICKKTLAELNWVGFADFDVLENDNGEYKIIEINPRVPASIRAAAISGVNYPEIILSDLLYGNIPNYTYVPGKQLRYMGLDIAWFLASDKRFKCQPSWFRFWGKNLYYQEGGGRDCMAMLTSFVEGIKKQFSSSFRKSKAGIRRV